MGETKSCLFDPSIDCPNVARIDRLEGEIDDLRRQNSDSHDKIFGRLTKLETWEAVQDEKYNVIIDKLDILTKKVDILESKPAKKWESMASNVLWAIVGAIILFVLSHLGLTA